MSKWQLLQVTGGLQTNWRLHQITSTNSASWQLLQVVAKQPGTAAKWRLNHIDAVATGLGAVAVYKTEVEAYDLVTVDISSFPPPYSFSQVSGPFVTLSVVGGIASYIYPGIDAFEGSSIVIAFTAGGGIFNGTATTKGYPIQEYVLDATMTWQPVEPEVIL